MTPAPNAFTTQRERLGEVIRFNRNQRGFSKRQAADASGVSVGEFESWEDGHAVPQASHWARLKGWANGLRKFSDLHQRAVEEEEVTKKDVTVMRPETKINSLAPKLAVVSAPIVEPRERVDAVPLKPVRTKPPGSMTRVEVNRRRARGEELLRNNPGISNEDMRIALEDEFGIALSATLLADIRAQLRVERTGSAPRPQPSAPTQNTSASELQAAIDLILSSVPNLRTLTISVDDSGEASVDYKVREVVVRETGGSLKMRRAE